jgi:hypothetical protein
LQSLQSRSKRCTSSPKPIQDNVLHEAVGYDRAIYQQAGNYARLYASDNNLNMGNLYGYQTTAASTNWTITYDTSTTASTGTWQYAINDTSTYAATGYPYNSFQPIQTWSAEYSIAANDPAEVKRQALLRAIRSNLSPAVRRRTVLPTALDLRERVARASLRDMLSEADWRRYLTNGFIMVKGKSGYWYQLFSNGSNVQVYMKGNRVASICIHSDGVPPTDHVINMKLLIELDEQQVWHGGNVSAASRSLWGESPVVVPRPLIEVAQQFRRAA